MFLFSYKRLSSRNPGCHPKICSRHYIQCQCVIIVFLCRVSRWPNPTLHSSSRLHQPVTTHLWWGNPWVPRFLLFDSLANHVVPSSKSQNELSKFSPFVPGLSFAFHSHIRHSSHRVLSFHPCAYWDFVDTVSTHHYPSPTLLASLDASLFPTSRSLTSSLCPALVLFWHLHHFIIIHHLRRIISLTHDSSGFCRSLNIINLGSLYIIRELRI